MIDTNNIEFIEKLVCVNRVTKVVKGGRNFGFAAMVIVGDKKGLVGFGTGKAKEVTEARNKATKMAKKNLSRIPLREGRTVHHDAAGKYGAAKVVIRNAPPGTGIIAGGAMRAVFEVMGVNNILSKTYGSTNPINVVKGTVKALISMQTPGVVSAKRKKQVVLS